MSPERLVAIVEDDESLRTALIGLLRSLSHRALGFESAERFFESGDPDRFDCVVTDLQMSGLSGIELKRKLDRDGKSVPVIMITARTEQGLIDQAMKSGAFCLLRKPFETSLFVDCLDRALGTWLPRAG